MSAIETCDMIKFNQNDVLKTMEVTAECKVEEFLRALDSNPEFKKNFNIPLRLLDVKREGSFDICLLKQKIYYFADENSKFYIVDGATKTTVSRSKNDLDEVLETVIEIQKSNRNLKIIIYVYGQNNNTKEYKYYKVPYVTSTSVQLSEDEILDQIDDLLNDLNPKLLYPFSEILKKIIIENDYEKTIENFIISKIKK